MSTTTRTTTTTMDRIDMIQSSRAYTSKVRQPKHATTDAIEDLYQPGSMPREPKHRKESTGPKHRLWSIEQA